MLLLFRQLVNEWSLDCNVVTKGMDNVGGQSSITLKNRDPVCEFSKWRQQLRFEMCCASQVLGAKRFSKPGFTN